jgi:hypothetical protein
MKALLLTPHDSSYTEVQAILEQSLRELDIGFTMRGTLLSEGTLMGGGILKAILEADLIIADVTRNFSYNRSNIMLELGFALGQRKPIVLLLSTDTDSEESLPEAFASYPILTYDPNDLSSMRPRLGMYLRHQLARRKPSP